MAATANTTTTAVGTATTNSPPPPSSSVVAAAAANATANLSPRYPSLTRTESPPWTQIVRGSDTEPVIAPVSPPSEHSSDNINSNINNNINVNVQENCDNAGGVGGGKKVAWNKKPINGPVENVGPGPVVMGPSEAWPALSESTSKASPKLDSSSKNLSDFGSISSPQVTGTESSLSIASSVQPQPQSSSTSPKPTTSNVNHNSMPNHGRPVRQKSMKRDGGGNLQANGIFSHQPSSPVEGSNNYNHGSTKPTTGDGSDTSGRGGIQNHVHRESGSRNASGDHHQLHNSFRRGSGGSHAREGSHQNYGGRRGDQDRGNDDWNHQRSFNGRDATMQPRVSPRGFRPPPVHPAPFVHPAPMRPTFINPMGVAEVPMFYFPAVPFVAPVSPGPVFIHAVPDPQLNAKIVNQIDYYFSNENLIKDTYLRQNMDENGWVPVTVIANFRKVMQLTENIQQILDAMRSSTVVEVQGDKIRKRDDWVRWIMPPTVQFPTTPGSQSPKSPTIDTMSAHFQNVKLDEKSFDQNHSMGQLDVNVATVSRSISDDLNSPSQTVTGGASSSSSEC